MACSSDHGTIHIFNVSLNEQGIKLANEEKDEEAKFDMGGSGAPNASGTTNEKDQAKPQNKKSKLNFMKGLNNYFGSQWSFARFKMPNEDGNATQTCAFSQDGNHLIVVSSDGMYYLAEI